MRFRLLWPAILLPLLVLPLIGSGYYLRLAELLLIQVIAGLGLQMLTGYTGLISLGQAGFMAIGAYATAYFLQLGFPLFPAILLGVLLAALAGILLGIPANRLSGPYLAIVTLAFGMGISVWIGRTEWLGGSSGLVVSIPSLSSVFWSQEQALYTGILLIAISAFIVARQIVRSRTGLVWQALRDRELAAVHLGYSAWQYKTLSFVVSAAYGGLAGSLLALYIGYLSPQSFGFTLSVSLLAGIVLGGLGHLGGAVLGVALLSLLEQNLLPVGLSGLSWMLEGGLMLIVVLLFPKGLWPKINRLC